VTNNIINKIGIVICSPREIDIYKNLFKKLPDKKYNLLINDLSSSNFDKLKIIKITKYLKNICFLSSIYKKKKYSLILSTGEIDNYKVSIYSFFRFAYAITIGNLIECTILKKIFIKIFKKPLSAGGFNCNLGLPWYPERDLGVKTVKFPDGADVKLKIYPENIHKIVFDFFLYLTDYEGKKLQQKISKTKIKKITYLRYLNSKKNKFNFTLNFKNQKFDEKKKIIYWLPTYINTFAEKNKNIELWIPRLLFLRKFYNLIIRPHPRTLLEDPSFKKKLIFNNLIIDDKLNQENNILIQSSDIIFCDYGGSVFSSIFLKKPVILLNLSNNSTFVKSLNQIDSLDMIVRSNLINLDLTSNENKIYISVKKCLSKKYRNIIYKSKKKIFGKKKACSLDQLTKFLLRNIN